jgi:hypothetical protein
MISPFYNSHLKDLGDWKVYTMFLCTVAGILKVIAKISWLRNNCVTEVIDGNWLPCSKLMASD